MSKSFDKSHRTYKPFLWLFILGASHAIESQAQALAFPGAEGFGRFTSGGRGGKVIEVTTLNDGGPGSFRTACQDSGTRTVVFRVSGTIPLNSTLTITHGNLTIAGQTAPGDGVCIKDYPVVIQADNIIVRYMRFRLGDKHKLADDAFSGLNHHTIIIDHCSMSWGIDECSTWYNNQRFTLQLCIISESLNHSCHKKGDHGYGGIWGGKGATFHHNLFAHHSSRTPRFNGSRPLKTSDEEIVDFRNNVIYNWGFNSAYGGEGGRQNIVANFYKAGPGTKPGALRYRIVNPWNENGRWFVEENYVDGYPKVTEDNWAGGVQAESIRVSRVDEPFPAAPVATQSAETAFQRVLDEAGANRPKRDTLDARIVKEVRTGTATYGGIWGSGTGIIDSQAQVGGWPELKTFAVPADQDHDGMADTWELANGLDPQNPSDQNGDLNANGYTNLEEYLHYLTIKDPHLKQYQGNDDN